MSAGQSQSGYHVQLEVFEGPLDLLLRLIQKQEMDITRVSLALVTDQYLDYMRGLEAARVADLADFVAVAAQLILIKSQVLLPKPQAQEEEEEDVGLDLVERLKLYRQFKQVAQALRSREEAGLRSFARLVPAPDLERRLSPGGGDLTRLLHVVRQVLAERPEESPVDEVVSPVVVTLEAKIAHLRQLIQQQPRLDFGQMLVTCRSRQEIVVSFLAVLEMIKQAEITVAQDGLFGPIRLERAPLASPACGIAPG